MPVMRSIHDLHMATLPIEDAAFAANPHPHLEAARDRHPWLAVEVSWRPFPGVWRIRELPLVFS